MPTGTLVGDIRLSPRVHSPGHPVRSENVHASGVNGQELMIRVYFGADACSSGHGENRKRLLVVLKNLFRDSTAGHRLIFFRDSDDSSCFCSHGFLQSRFALLAGFFLCAGAVTTLTCTAPHPKDKHFCREYSRIHLSFPRERDPRHIRPISSCGLWSGNHRFPIRQERAGAQRGSRWTHPRLRLPGAQDERCRHHR